MSYNLILIKLKTGQNQVRWTKLKKKNKIKKKKEMRRA